MIIQMLTVKYIWKLRFKSKGKMFRCNGAIYYSCSKQFTVNIFLINSVPGNSTPRTEWKTEDIIQGRIF